MNARPDRDRVLASVRRTRPGDAAARAAAKPEDIVDLFAAAATAAGATVARGPDAVALIRAFWQDHGLSGPVVRADDSLLAGLDDLPGVHTGAASPNDRVGIGRATAAIAETGTLVMVATPKTPVSLNFLPETHIVVVDAAAICPAYEDVWPLLRGLNPPPRAVNLITGPSRTDNIELTLQIGVHGPRALHIVIRDHG